MVKPVLVLYNPALHQGFIQVYERYKGKVDTLAIVGPELIAEISHTERDLSRVEPAIIAQAIRGLGVFKNVEVLDPSALQALTHTPLIASDHAVVKELLEKYLPKASITWESTFLRWDMPKALSQQPVDGDYTISEAEFDAQCISLAETEAQKSAVWWRQVGVAAFKDGKLLLTAHNEAMPEQFISYAEGDPRSWFDAGVRIDLSTDIHGEQALIATAAARGISLEGASLYVTVFPCPTCANLIAAAGIKKCYFRSGYSLINGQRVLKAYGVELIWVK